METGQGMVLAVEQKLPMSKDTWVLSLYKNTMKEK